MGVNPPPPSRRPPPSLAHLRGTTFSAPLAASTVCEYCGAPSIILAAERTGAVRCDGCGAPLQFAARQLGPGEGLGVVERSVVRGRTVTRPRDGSTTYTGPR